MGRDRRADRAMGFGGLILLVVTALFVGLDPDRAPAVLALTLLSTCFPLIRGWRAASGTALRPVLIWAFVAVVLAIAAQLSGLAEPIASGRPWLGRWTYLAVLASLAALTSALNARTPGAGAWALLMVMLVVVFLIPWLEEPGRFRRALGIGQLRLDAPWTIFFVLVAGTGVTNYLPTRYGPAAVLLGLGYLLEYLSLTRPDWSQAARLSAWSGFSWCLAASVWIVFLRATGGIEGSRSASDPLTRDWLWFRDHWGVVWGLRTAERFNASADRTRWPFRLGWFGVIRAEGSGTGDPAVAVSTFRGLIRRFVKPERLAEIFED